MKKVRYYIFLFFLASILGWCGEIIFNLVVNDKLVNPGTLSLCWCPVYGVAAIIIDLITNMKFKIWQNALILGFVSIVDEYLSAYISEEYFNNRLWDYSNFPLNFQGRVCLPIVFIFIACGLISIYTFIPKAKKFYEKHEKIVNIISYILLIIFVLNIIYDALH